MIKAQKVGEMMKYLKKWIAWIATVACMVTMIISVLPMVVSAASDLGNGWQGTFGPTHNLSVSVDGTEKVHVVTFANDGNAQQAVASNNGLLAPIETGKYAFSFRVDPFTTSTEITIAVSDEIGRYGTAIGKHDRWNGWFLTIDGIEDGEGTASFYSDYQNSNTKIGSTGTVKAGDDNFVYAELIGNTLHLYLNGVKMAQFELWGAVGSGSWGRGPYDNGTALEIAVGSFCNTEARIAIDVDPTITQAELTALIDECETMQNFMATTAQETAFRNAIETAKTANDEAASSYDRFEAEKALKAARNAYRTNKGGKYNFYMQNGASVRTAADTSGLRFTSYFGGNIITFLEAEKEAGRIQSYSFHTLMIPQKLLFGQELTAETPDVLDVTHDQYHESGVAGTTRITAVLWGYELENYTVDVAARTYLKIMDSDGVAQEIYTPFTVENNVRNIATVAGKARKDESVTYTDAERKVLEEYDVTLPWTYVFNVEDYEGATDNETVSNAVTALKKKIAQANAVGRDADYELNFEENRNYRFSQTLNLTAMNDVTVNGNGAQFVFTEFVNALAVSNCKEMTLKNFSVDYDPLPYIQGTVSSSSPSILGDSTVTITVDPGYLADPAVLGTGTIYGNIHDRTTGAVAEGTDHTNTFSNAKVNDGKITVKTDFATASLFGAGKVVTLYPRATGAMLFTNHENVKLENVNLYSSPGFGISSNGGYGNMQLKNVNIKPGAKPTGATQERLKSTNADGMHFSEHVVGPTLDECTVTHCGDDCINVQSFYYQVLEVVDENTIIAAPLYDRNTPVVGEKLEFCEKTSYDTIGTTTIAAIERYKDESYEDLKNQAWTGVYYWTENVNGYVYKITLDTTIQGLKQFDHFTSLDRLNSGTTIKNSTFGWNRARGIVVKSPNTLIENNRIERCTNDGIMGLADLAWAEAHFVSGLVVKNNTLVNTNTSSNALSSPNVDSIGSIVVGVIPLKGASAGLMENYGNKSITIEGNTITDSRTCAIVVTNADGVTIRDNTVTDPFNQKNKGSTKNVYNVTLNAGIFIGKCKNITVTGNTVKATYTGVSSAVQTDSVSGTVTNSGNTLSR